MDPLGVVGLGSGLCLSMVLLHLMNDGMDWNPGASEVRSKHGFVFLLSAICVVTNWCAQLSAFNCRRQKKVHF